MATSATNNIEFFRGVAEAAFANPFGEARERIDASLAGTGKGVERDDVIDALLGKVDKAIRSNTNLDVRTIAASERRSVELTLLFHVFHRHAHDLDDLIQRQLSAGSDPVQAAFGEQAVTELVSWGFHPERAERLLGMLYQVRRAFYFISRSLLGSSRSMQRLRERVWQNVFTDDIGLYESTLWSRMEDFSTFFFGETGTGKGTAAAAIGRSGWIDWDPRRKRFSTGFEDGFVSINLSQFPESLIESELFGHRKGAFTGAFEPHEGVFSVVRPHGTIFLDEIGEVSEPVQIKLLRVLQERTFTPVGSRDSLIFRGRIVAATNRPPATLRSSGAMRDDFYYRLCSDVIEVPPLRQRLAEEPGELVELVDRILVRMLGEQDEEVASRVLSVIGRRLGPAYAWPGNVRELEQCVRRVLITQDYSGDPQEAQEGELANLRISAAELVGRYCNALYAQLESYEAVGRVVGLDRRTVKRHVDAVADDR